MKQELWELKKILFVVFVYFIMCWIDAGVAVGLDRETATLLCINTMTGSLHMLTKGIK